MSAVGAAIGVLSRHTGNLPVGLRGTNPSLGWHWRYNAFAIPLFGVASIVFAWLAHPGLALASWLLEPLIWLAFTQWKPWSAEANSVVTFGHKKTAASWRRFSPSSP